VEIDIVPEPGPGERDVLLRALGELDGASVEPPAYRSAWRLAALEPAGDEGLYDEATTRRFRRPGASRA
jgi:hypothetical protein